MPRRWFNDGAWRHIFGDRGHAVQFGSGLVWHEVPDSGSVTTETLRDVAYDGLGSLIAVAADLAIIKSPDEGSDWEHVAESHDTKLNDRLNVITYGAGPDLWILATLTGSSDELFSSPDGQSWTSRSGTSGSVREVGFGNGVYCTAGWDARLKRSTDGITWSENQTGLAGDTMGVGTDGAGVWSVGGSAGELLISTDDASSWRLANDSGVYTSDWVRSIDYGDGLFVAVSSNGKIITSPDADNWSEAASSGVVTTETLHAVAFGGGLWIAVGANGVIIESSDGDNWRLIDSGTTVTLLGVAYASGPSRFVAVGQNGMILRQSLAGTATITGTVTDSGGVAIEGATVAAEGPTSATATTDANGAYTLTDLTLGVYELTASHGDYVSELRTIDVQADRVEDYALTALADYRTEVLNDSPIAYWRFDDSATPAVDETGNGHDADVYTSAYASETTTAPTFGAAALINEGTAADFERANQEGLAPADDPVFDVASLTIEAWIKIESSDIVQAVLGRDDTTNTGTARACKLQVRDTGELQGVIWVAGSPFAPTSAGLVNDGLVHHVAMTYDTTSGDLKLYIDGAQDGSDVTGGGDVDPSNLPPQLGFNDDADTGLEQFFDGVIDEIVYYGHELSAIRVQAHHDAGQ